MRYFLPNKKRQHNRKERKKTTKEKARDKNGLEKTEVKKEETSDTKPLVSISRKREITIGETIIYPPI